MSILLMAHALELTDLTAAQKFVLLIMANYANDEGQNVYPSHDTIAKRTSMSRRTVVTTIKQLVELDYIAVEGKRGNRQNIYSINVLKVLQMCSDCTPNSNRCEATSQNPLDLNNLKELKDLKDIKGLKIHDDTEIAHLKAQQYEMMQALAATCSRVLADNRPILGRFSKALLKLGYTPTDVTAFATWWYKYDWRGKMKQAPYPAQVQELIGLSKSKQADNLPSGADVDKFRRLWEEQHRNEEE